MERDVSYMLGQWSGVHEKQYSFLGLKNVRMRTPEKMILMVHAQRNYSVERFLQRIHFDDS